MEIQVYDIEIYPNLFLVVFKNVKTGEVRIFEISRRRDDRHELMLFLKNTPQTQVGFNNLAFDYPMLHFFIRLYPRKLKGYKLVELLYKKGQKIISSPNRWDSIIRNPHIQQLDLFLINHYDNFAKSTSLKVLEFNMRMDNVQELPYPYNKHLTDSEIDDIISYCKNDVESTHKFYTKNISNIEFRDRMSKLYRQDLMNYNDVKIGGSILLDALSKGMKLSPYEIKKMRTERDEMKISDIMFDYLNFQSKELNILTDWWRQKIIYETKGQFTKLNLDDVAPLLPYCNTKEEPKGKLKNLNIVVNDFQFDFGTGGLHGACHPGVFKADENMRLSLIDVSSYYPNLAYQNGLHPMHIPKEIFLSVIKMLYDQRMNAKEVNDDAMVAAIKLALNGYLYGNSNSKHSFIYDPQFMMTICVNGQLLLTMLAEQCMYNEIKVVQVNTDGVLVYYHKDKKPILDKIVKNWMELTKLKLDYDHFDLVIQRDTNNYLARYLNGELKLKGVFDYEYAKNGEWHKNFSALIVPKALKVYFVDGIRPEEFIRNHQDMYDFFLRTKFDKLTKLVKRRYDEDWNLLNQTLLQNVTRYYVSVDGDEFIKIMKPLKHQVEDREFRVEAGYRCTDLNRITGEGLNHMRNKLNYDYYITKANEIIEEIEDYLFPEQWSFKLVDDLKQ